MQLTSNGIIKDDPQAILDNLTSEAFKQVDGFSNIPSGIQNNLLQESVILLSQFQDMISNMMNGISPSYANDFLILELGEAFGLKIKDKQLPNTTITFYGLPGVIIPEGVKVSNADNSKTFITTKSDIIKENGEVSIYCEGADYYDNIAPANSLNVLVNQIQNVNKCTNLSDTVESTPAETVSQFRERFQIKVLANKMGTAAALDYALKSVEGVNERLCTYRTSQVREEERIKAMLEIIVGGGDDYSVANAIFNSIFYPDILISNPSNNETNRTVNIIVSFNGVNFPITFTRPKIKQLTIDVSLSVQSGFINIPSEAMLLLLEPYFEEYVNNLKISYSPNGYKFDDLIYQCFKDNNYDIDIITGIKYTLLVNEEPAELNEERQLETEDDVAYSLFELKLTLGGAGV